MFGIGTFEFLIIVLVAILVLGPDHLPKVMKTVTKLMSNYRRISTELQRSINLEANIEEFKQLHGAGPNPEKTKKKRKKKKVVPDTAPADQVASTVDCASSEAERERPQKITPDAEPSVSPAKLDSDQPVNQVSQRPMSPESPGVGKPDRARALTLADLPDQEHSVDKTSSSIPGGSA